MSNADAKRGRSLLRDAVISSLPSNSFPAGVIRILFEYLVVEAVVTLEKLHFADRLSIRDGWDLQEVCRIDHSSQWGDVTNVTIDPFNCRLIAHTHHSSKGSMFRCFDLYTGAFLCEHQPMPTAPVSVSMGWCPIVNLLVTASSAGLSVFDRDFNPLNVKLCCELTEELQTNPSPLSIHRVDHTKAEVVLAVTSETMGTTSLRRVDVTRVERDTVYFSVIPNGDYWIYDPVLCDEQGPEFVEVTPCTLLKFEQIPCELLRGLVCAPPVPRRRLFAHLGDSYQVKRLGPWIYDTFLCFGLIDPRLNPA
jgi:hypothetical protein